MFLRGLGQQLCMKCSRMHNKHTGAESPGQAAAMGSPVLPVFVFRPLITSALCASQRSHVTIFEQLQTILVCLLVSIDAEGQGSVL